MTLADVQRFIPARLKYRLKPYYRKIFSNRLHVILSPTSRCNYKCSYCPVITKNNYVEMFPKKSELRVDQWLRAFQKLPPAMIYVAGGEPFLYAALPELVNNLPKKHQLLGIVSNISLPASVYRKIKRPYHLNASFHREFVSADDFIARVRELQEFVHLAVNIVATPENLPVISAIDALMKSHRIALHVDPYIDAAFRYSAQEQALLRKYTQTDRRSLVNFEDFSARHCSAGRNYIHIMPGGEVFTCGSGIEYTFFPFQPVSRERIEQFRMGNILDPDFSLNASDVVCTLPCIAACDRDSVTTKPARDTKTKRLVNILPIGTKM